MSPSDLKDDGFCFVCGRNNPLGLKLDFRKQGSKTLCSFVPGKNYQGFQDIVHGGIITAVLDEAMMKAVLSREIVALTAEITVRFRNPLRVSEACNIEAEIINMKKGLIETAATMKKEDGTLIAEARAKLFAKDA